jgi:hypothetical protein
MAPAHRKSGEGHWGLKETRPARRIGERTDPRLYKGRNAYMRFFSVGTDIRAAMKETEAIIGQKPLGV